MDILNIIIELFKSFIKWLSQIFNFAKEPTTTTVAPTTTTTVAPTTTQQTTTTPIPTRIRIPIPTRIPITTTVAPTTTVGPILEQLLSDIQNLSRVKKILALMSTPRDIKYVGTKNEMVTILISTMTEILKNICLSQSNYSITQVNIFEKLTGLILYIKRNRQDLISDVLISDLITFFILVLITQGEFIYDYNVDTITIDKLSISLPNNIDFETITGYKDENKTINYSNFKDYIISTVQSDKVVILDPNEPPVSYFDAIFISSFSLGLPNRPPPTQSYIIKTIDDIVANMCTSTSIITESYDSSYEYIGIM